MEQLGSVLAVEQLVQPAAEGAAVWQPTAAAVAAAISGAEQLQDGASCSSIISSNNSLTAADKGPHIYIL